MTITKKLLCNDLSNKTGTYGSTTLTDSETELLLDSDGSDELNVDNYVIAGLAHLNVSGKLNVSGNVGSSEVELGSVTGEEGLLTAAFLLGQNVNLSLELGVGVNGTGLAEDLSSLDLVLLNTTEQSTDVVTSFCGIHELVEHFDTGDNVNMTVELITPIACEQGLRFAIREGGRTVGSGVVSEILD